MKPSMVRANFNQVLERIHQACQRSGRSEKDITLVAVTKKVPQEKILEALSLGVGHIGESYIQEALKKQAEFGSKIQAKWHLIGHLQTNKVKAAIPIFDVIQSVDSVRLVSAVDKKAAETGKVQNCFVEVKISGETTKSGLEEGKIDEFFGATQNLKNIKITGMMCMAPYFEKPELARPYFARARKIFERLSLRELSMGMSGDFEVAIEEGSTMVRIGQALFGARA